MSEVMIEARDLTKHYDDVVALDKVSMEVRSGEVLGFLGPNGAGKSTTMRILTCFTAPSDGTAKINGCDIFEDSIGVRRSIGYLPESTALYPDMLVLEYLEFVAEMRGIRSDARKAIKTVVEETGLGDMFAKPIKTLSKGYRQRVGLAQALLHRPPILILDEPLSGLDPNQAVEIRDLIKEIGRERTVVLSTHNLSEVAATCDRVLIISQGKIVADDTPTGLKERAGKQRYVVTLAAKDGIEAALKGIDGVERVRSLGAEANDEMRFEVLPSSDADLRGALFRTAVDNDYTLLGMTREGQNLEQIFRELTTAATDAASDATPAESKS